MDEIIEIMKKNGPWTINKSAVKYKNPWIEVREDQVTQPDGNPGIFGVVEMGDGVSVLAIDDENNVYLTQEFHYAVEQVTIESVSGAIDEGETPIEAAKRELQEELGITAQNWTPLGKIDPFTSVVKSAGYLFLAQNLSFGKSAQEGTESISMLKVPFDEAYQKIIDSEITHGASSVLILKAKQHL